VFSGTWENDDLLVREVEQGPPAERKLLLVFFFQILVGVSSATHIETYALHPAMLTLLLKLLTEYAVMDAQL
jgi:hypothetical protein